MSRVRPATPPGAWGEITLTPTTTGKWQAYTRLRTYTGHTKQVKHTAPTKSAARHGIEQKCQQLLTTTGENTTLTPTSPLPDLLKLWLAQHPVSDRSKRIYRQCIRLHIEPALGALRLQEITTPAVHAFLQSLTPATAKTARAVLSAAWQYATQQGIATTNPIRDATTPQRERHTVNVPTPEQLSDFRAHLIAWCDYTDETTTTPRRGDMLLEIIDVCAGTGMRLGEVLALHWENVNMTTGEIEVCAQIDAATGGRTAQLKTESSHRVIVCQPVALDALQRQKQHPFFQHVPNEPRVFPTLRGTYKSVANVNRQLRDAKAGMPDDLKTITPHTYRRAMATALEQRYGLIAASHYLGHSNTSVTEQSYVGRPPVVRLPLS